MRIGEVVRYTITYTPAHDRILPSPPFLFLKIKNTSAIALRAAFVHGPYTLYAAAYPAVFSPNEKFCEPRTYGVPEFEPQLKAGGTFTAHLTVPEDVRQTAGRADRHRHSPGGEEDVKSVSWIIEVASQVIFSNSAAVHYEVFLARDEKSLNTGFASSITGASSTPAPGQISDHQESAGAKEGRHSGQPKGVYSRAIEVRVDDTASLWNTPKMPEWEDDGRDRVENAEAEGPNDGQTPDSQHRPKRQKKVHLVILTHGLHSNLGADMLFMKESIDATAKQAKIDAKARRAKRRQEESEKAEKAGKSHEEHHGDERTHEDGEIKHPKQVAEENVDEEEDDEEVIVRGFSGNAVRTERGIKYLGKRLARYVLAMTYPDQPFKPVTKKSAATALSHAMRPSVPTNDGDPTHHNSTIVKEPYNDKQLPYKITSISFIAHSLGGLVQMYAVAYIQKHSPEFFDRIKPINFIALASPFLGLSNENPLYVKFALDFGLVGRTGQDLGLTWRAPTIARSGWGAIVSSMGEGAKKVEGQSAPESKPLLRILPTGPAHVVLKKFRNRTVYSNVVNDGVVPLRTSCLLFLDWQGLGRVEKARRENGLVGTIANWGWAELTGANSGSPMRRTFSGYGSEAEADASGSPASTPAQAPGDDVPQPPPYATADDDTHSLKSLEDRPAHQAPKTENSPATKDDSALTSIMKFFTPTPVQPTPKLVNNPKPSKIYKRSQTLKMGSGESSSTSLSKSPGNTNNKASTGDEEHNDPDRLSAPPKTTFFESAGDLLKPPLPSVAFLIDPSTRPRTIFHDRVYHPEDIPPPPLRKRPTGLLSRRRSSSSDPAARGVKHADSTLSAKDYDDTKHTNPDKDPNEIVDGSAMKVEEKIARAYHRDLSWRKVLVRLEPDAHNNMIVRRMFANAYGWPVVKHLCDTHFSDSAAANTRDEDAGSQENAKSTNEATGTDGQETNTNAADLKRHNPSRHHNRTDSEAREATDNVPSLPASSQSSSLAKALHESKTGHNLGIPSALRPGVERADSETTWSDRDWMDSEIDSDDPDSGGNVSGRNSGSGWNWTEAIAGKKSTSPQGTDKADIDAFLASGKRTSLGLNTGLSPRPQTSGAAREVLGGGSVESATG